MLAKKEAISRKRYFNGDYRRCKCLQKVLLCVIVASIAYIVFYDTQISIPSVSLSQMSDASKN
jgi:hypothetical protein